MREKRKGVWELRVYLGQDEHGKVRHQQATFHGAKREAQRALNRLVGDLEQDDVARDQAMLEVSANPDWGPRTTFNDALEGWRSNGWADLPEHHQAVPEPVGCAHPVKHRRQENLGHRAV